MLCETALETVPEIHGPIFQVFLSMVDRYDANAPASLGYRRAQVILACSFLMRDRRDLAEVIFTEMQEEGTNRLWELYNDLESVTSEEFREYSEREKDFTWMESEKKKYLQEFFSWFPGFFQSNTQLSQEDKKKLERKQLLMKLE